MKFSFCTFFVQVLNPLATPQPSGKPLARPVYCVAPPSAPLWKPPLDPVCSRGRPVPSVRLRQDRHFNDGAPESVTFTLFMRTRSHLASGLVISRCFLSSVRTPEHPRQPLTSLYTRTDGGPVLVFRDGLEVMYSYYCGHNSNNKYMYTIKIYLDLSPQLPTFPHEITFLLSEVHLLEFSPQDFRIYAFILRDYFQWRQNPVLKGSLRMHSAACWSPLLLSGADGQPQSAPTQGHLFSLDAFNFIFSFGVWGGEHACASAHRGGAGEGGSESQAGSMLSVKPRVGLDLTTARS